MWFKFFYNKICLHITYTLHYFCLDILETCVTRYKIVFLVSDFNEDLTFKMINTAKEKVKDLDLNLVKVYHASGSYDIPLLAKWLFEKTDIDGIVTLGSIITGETKHDEVISNSTSKTLQEISLKFSKPISFGIIGPAPSRKHVEKRIIPVSKHAVESLNQTLQEMAKLSFLSKNELH